MTNLKGRVVAISGGARGIGLATTRKFVAAGAKVVVGDLDSAGAEQICEAQPDSMMGLHLDVSSRASFEEFYDIAERSFGHVDVLVNNAGIMPSGPFLAENEALTDKILAVNLRGVINGCRIAGQHMQPRGSGVIINVASLAGLFGAPGLATYCASKFAVVGLTEALEHEFAVLGISVAAVLPAVVNTELSAGASYPRYMRPLIEVEADDVATRIVKIASRGGSTATVPSVVGPLVKLSRVLARKPRHALERVAGLDKAYTQADPALRAPYHNRVSGQH